MSRFNQKHVVIMGVSGCGKSTVGKKLSRLSNIPYVDGDDLHRPKNVEKMRSGLALTDEDRLPWLKDCGQALSIATSGLILGCSALKYNYREIIRENASPALPVFVHLEGDKEVLLKRMETRQDHYMPPSLLDSQFAILEPPLPDERSITINVDASAQNIAATIFEQLGWGAPYVEPRQ